MNQRDSEARSLSEDPVPTPEELLARVRKAVESGDLLYQCCFCREGVPAAEVSAVGIITRWGHPAKEQAYQQWFCHLTCFERVSGETFEAEPEGEDE